MYTRTQLTLITVPLLIAACAEGSRDIPYTGGFHISDDSETDTSDSSDSTETAIPEDVNGATETGQDPPSCDDQLLNGDETDVDCGGSCEPCGLGEDCGTSRDCETEFCSMEVCGYPSSCAELLATKPETLDGEYLVQTPASGGPFVVACDMSSDGGGWTLVGNVVNDDIRHWDSYEVFIDDSEFGSLAQAFAPHDYKSLAWSAVSATDLMLRTEDYAAAWNGLLPSSSVADWYEIEFDETACSTVFIGGLPSYTEQLSAAQAKLFEVVVRPWDTNGECFPGGGENTAIGFLIQGNGNWVYGIGNTPNGVFNWANHDSAMPKLASLGIKSCTPGYPCNPQGVVYNGVNCEDSSCKTSQTQIWVR